LAFKVLVVRIENVRDDAISDSASDSNAAPSSFTSTALPQKIQQNTFRVPRMHMPMEKTAFVRDVTVYLPVKEDQEDDNDDDESENEGANTGDVSASIPAVAVAIA
jgi:hypothetical protein